MKHFLALTAVLVLLVVAVMKLKEPETIIKEIPVEKIVIKEVIKEVPVEKIVEKPVEKIVYVDKVIYQDRIVYQDKIVYQDRPVYQQYNPPVIFRPMRRMRRW